MQHRGQFGACDGGGSVREDGELVIMIIIQLLTTMYLYRADTLHTAWDVHTGCGNYSMLLSKLWSVHYVHSDTAAFSDS